VAATEGSAKMAVPRIAPDEVELEGVMILKGGDRSGGVESCLRV
jgi:hypothetical protein